MLRRNGSPYPQIGIADTFIHIPQIRQDVGNNASAKAAVFLLYGSDRLFRPLK
jgi:hypothetical protein